MKGGKRLILPGLRSQLLHSRESARNREIKRKRGRDRQTDRQTDTGNKALMGQRCFNQHGVGVYIVVILSKIKIKIPDLQNTRRSLLKREEGTYHHNEKLTKEIPEFLSPSLGKGMPLLLIPEHSGINKGQRFPDRSIIAHGKPPVNCFLTDLHCCVSFRYTAK